MAIPLIATLLLVCVAVEVGVVRPFVIEEFPTERDERGILAWCGLALLGAVRPTGGDA